MTTSPASGRAPHSADPASGPTRLARWAVGLAAAVVIVVVVSYTIFAVAYLVEGSDAISDTWVGLLGAVALLGGLSVSLVAFGMAVFAKVRHGTWPLLWLPLSVFPALFALALLAEAFLRE